MRSLPLAVGVAAGDGTGVVARVVCTVGVVGVTGGTGNVAIRLEAAGRRADDYEVPEWPEDTLDGSFNRSRTATLGLSWVGSRGYLGAAYTDQRSTYGLPGHSHEYEDCHPHGSSLHCGGHDHDQEHEHGEGDEHGVRCIRSQVVGQSGERQNYQAKFKKPIQGCFFHAQNPLPPPRSTSFGGQTTGFVRNTGAVA